VNGTISSGDYGFFQIYQSTENPCQYEVVGVKVQGDRDSFSGAVSASDYATIFAGGCGFEVTLGDYVSDKVLQIFNGNGEVIFETFDFIPESVTGCALGSLNPFSIDPAASVNCRVSELARVPEFEKTVDSGTPGGVGIKSIECIS
jgi:hypothetical protein